MEQFDFVVVGGGTAGCVLAARLSQDASSRVLLLEAGNASGPAAMAEPAKWEWLSDLAVDWAYRTTRQAGTGAVHPLPRGKVLGGSSGISAMMHIRGHRLGYDAWEAGGATGWNYETILPFLKRSETAEGLDPLYRGTSGPMRVAPAQGSLPLWDAMFEAALAAGHPGNKDSNGAIGEGVCWSEVNVVGGKRQSAADAYLRPVLSRPNLTVLTGVHVQGLMVEGGRCVGVHYMDDDGIRSAYAQREVVLAAGVVGSAQLLMVSGIGPAAHLEKVGVDVVADLPGVGANLQDHPQSAVAYTAAQPITRLSFDRKPHVRLRSGLSDEPDLQIIFVDSPLYPRRRPGPENGYSIVFSLMTPISRGSVRLASADPEVAPLIDPNYLGDEHDLDRMMIGLRKAREIGQTDALAAWRDEEVVPGRTGDGDAQSRGYIRRSVVSYNHPVGTCRTGTDRNAVVDPRLRVHGIGALRVADASVMPSIISGNPNATVLAIAERAASWIAEG